MLNVDVIGFHLFEYARHFLTCCKRMLGLEYEFQQVGNFLVEEKSSTCIYISVHSRVHIFDTHTHTRTNTHTHTHTQHTEQLWRSVRNKPDPHQPRTRLFSTPHQHASSACLVKAPYTHPITEIAHHRITEQLGVALSAQQPWRESSYGVPRTK